MKKFSWLILSLFFYSNQAHAWFVEIGGWCCYGGGNSTGGTHCSRKLGGRLGPCSAFLDPNWVSSTERVANQGNQTPKFNLNEFVPTKDLAKVCSNEQIAKTFAQCKKK